MRAVWIILLIVCIGTLIYLTFIHRSWPAYWLARVGLLSILAVVAGVAVVSLRTPGAHS